MFRIITTDRLKHLEENDRRYRLLLCRVQQLYWLSEFKFMKNLTKWIHCGESPCGKYHSYSIERVRNDFRREVKEFLEQEANR